MKHLRNIVTLIALMTGVAATAQKVYNEGTVTYNVVVSTGSNQAKAADLLDGATQKVFIKGQMTRSELKSILGTGITLRDTKSGTGVTINEYGDDKVLIRMNKAEYDDANKKYVGIKFELKDETKTILGYNCKLAIATLNDGKSTFRVYYTTDLVFQNKDYGPQFNGLPGFPLEYEAEIGTMRVTYKADKISFDPITAALFDLPKAGYREMTYEEVKKLRTKN
ncbi:MAG: GLPGLI family protein [Chitinophagaceae bacterium]|nr:GLPGLI family protein [Chitinophagaceae bacterium]